MQQYQMYFCTRNLRCPPWLYFLAMLSMHPSLHPFRHVLNILMSLLHLCIWCNADIIFGLLACFLSFIHSFIHSGIYLGNFTTREFSSFFMSSDVQHWLHADDNQHAAFVIKHQQILLTCAYLTSHIWMVAPFYTLHLRCLECGKYVWLLYWGMV